MIGTVAKVRTRLLTAPLPRPWGPDVPEVHVIVVEVITDDGRRGTGFSWTPTIGAAAVQALLDHDITAFLIGKPAHPVAVWDDLWAHLHEAGGGGITTIAMAGIDLALWDLQARDLDRSVPALLGVRHRELPGYGSGVNLHYPTDELLEQVRRWLAVGYRAIKIKIGSPELERDLDRVAAVRELIGPGVALMLDANQRWDLPAALRGANALTRFDPYWLEEPVRADDTHSYVELRRRTSIPIAAGENVHHRYRFAELIKAGGIDVVQPNLVRVGGITPFLRIADLAATSGLQLAPHLLADVSAQLAVTLPGPVWVEEVEDTSFEQLGLVTTPTPVVRDGARIRIEDRPGLGLAFS
ncbi:mandelate racemase/muconate lactonizing enzyme family protein [Microlunatus speluncae]|uniref:mandelate racemase/muconate lactonizing enzyme family protein n=1 Tax=Microlunatus speluncae TaxID=2594267 RepID=UPI001266141E|nr:mandelate racemase/muconate lactonizing enzyme family protein [Microlunatus speluncae]